MPILNCKGQRRRPPNFRNFPEIDAHLASVSLRLVLGAYGKPVQSCKPGTALSVVISNAKVAHL